MAKDQEIAAALRQIARGYHALADAFAAGDGGESAVSERELAALREWGERGLTRPQARELFRRHGFAPQVVGGWVRGEWIERGEDDLLYTTERSRRRVADEDAGGASGT
ncbi:hypothetical protein GCM10027570_08010 [Streptomonospora sediminis]